MRSVDPRFSDKFKSSDLLLPHSKTIGGSVSSLGVDWQHVISVSCLPFNLAIGLLRIYPKILKVGTWTILVSGVHSSIIPSS